MKAHGKQLEDSSDSEESEDETLNPVDISNIRWADEESSPSLSESDSKNTKNQKRKFSLSPEEQRKNLSKKTKDETEKTASKSISINFKPSRSSP